MNPLTQLRRDLAMLVKDFVADAYAFVPDSVNSLTACVRPGMPYIDHHATFDASNVNLEVLFLVPKLAAEDWQETLDSLLADDSIAQAIETDPRFQTGPVTGWGVITINDGDVFYGSAVLPVSVFL